MMKLLAAASAVFAILLGLPAAGGLEAAAATSGAVFSMSNGSGVNRVLVFSRSDNGSLALVRRVATGGSGSGGPLQNAGGLAWSGQWLYVVNVGSDSLSVFKVNGTHLSRTDVRPVGANQPVSVAARGGLVYVLYSGARAGVRGFRRSASGVLTPISGSARPLTAAGIGAAQIGFIGEGSELLVTEPAAGELARYNVKPSGALRGPIAMTSPGAEPFGFDVAPDGTIVVAEAANHDEDAGTVSSYRLDSTGTPEVVSSSVAVTETATCWIVALSNGSYAYSTNPPDHSITGFHLRADGSLRKLDANGVTADTGENSFPIDLDASADSKFLYVLASSAHKILVYAIDPNGALSARRGVDNLPPTANGLVAR